MDFTDFTGELAVSPPLNQDEIDYLNEFADTRHVTRDRGPFAVGGDLGQGANDNQQQGGQPGTWCDLQFAADTISWNGAEKTYNLHLWVKYVIQTFLTPQTPELHAEMTAADERLSRFTFDHVVDGTLDAQDEESDTWRLVVENNVVAVSDTEVIYLPPVAI